MNANDFEVGELFAYVCGNRIELGVVKRKVSDDTYACWYHEGDTAARTKVGSMRKLANASFAPINHVHRDITCPICGTRMAGGDGDE